MTCYPAKEWTGLPNDEQPRRTEWQQENEAHPQIVRDAAQTLAFAEEEIAEEMAQEEQNAFSEFMNNVNQMLMDGQGQWVWDEENECWWLM